MKNTIKSHKNFKFPENNWITCGSFHLKWRPKLFETAQYGLVVAKKIFPQAVNRNRAKRLLRVWIQANRLPTDMDVLFIARPSILDTKMPEGINRVRTAINKIGK